MTRVVIESLGAGGDGKAGALFVPFALPGETVEIGADGRLLAVIDPSPDRREAPCPWFGRCGGCKLQHMTVESYRAWKLAALAKTLGQRRIAPPTEAPLWLAEGTRRRAEFAPGGGFRALKSHEILPVSDCLLLAPELNGGGREGLWTLCDDGLAGEGAPPRHVAFGGHMVEVPPRAFLQATRQGEAALQALVAAAVPAGARAVDLFCGLGTFTLPLGAKGYDSDRAAVAALTDAGGNADVRDLFKEPLQPKELAPYAYAVLDPPRAGAFAQTKALAASGVEKIVYVSCNPATFGRDARVLLDSGFALETLAPVDQFVYSPHWELVGVFGRIFGGKNGKRGGLDD
ncbi:putative RNA methyltransferase [Alphaproteobacteria bacterium]|nr:putative RNA methyltransferase [Alphaproteobacteria bacterium]